MGKLITSPRRSHMHQFVADLCRKTYPGFKIEEETRVEVNDRRKLPVDILIRELRVCIECHGQQHFKHITFFHKTADAFNDQVRNDRLKMEAIKAAGWGYIVVRYDEYQKLTTKKLAKQVLKAMQEI